MILGSIWRPDGFILVRTLEKDKQLRDAVVDPGKRLTMFPPGPETTRVVWGSATVPAVPRVPSAAAAAATVVFALVAALPLPLPVVGAGPLVFPPLPAVVPAAPLVLVLLGGGEVRGTALPVPLPLPLALPFDGGARPGARPLPLVSRAAPAAAAVATGDLGVAVAVVTGLWFEVGEERRGLVSPWRRAVGARARAVGPRATASAVVAGEEWNRW